MSLLKRLISRPQSSSKTPAATPQPATQTLAAPLLTTGDVSLLVADSSTPASTPHPRRAPEQPAHPIIESPPKIEITHAHAPIAEIEVACDDIPVNVMGPGMIPDVVTCPSSACIADVLSALPPPVSNNSAPTCPGIVDASACLLSLSAAIPRRDLFVVPCLCLNVHFGSMQPQRIVLPQGHTLRQALSSAYSARKIDASLFPPCIRDPDSGRLVCLDTTRDAVTFAGIACIVRTKLHASGDSLNDASVV